MSDRSDGDTVNGIGFTSSNFVSDLRILYRLLALFSLSFSLLNVTEWMSLQIKYVSLLFLV